MASCVANRTTSSWCPSNAKVSVAETKMTGTFAAEAVKIMEFMYLRPVGIDKVLAVDDGGIEDHGRGWLHSYAAT